MPVTPRVFCAVSAVIADAPNLQYATRAAHQHVEILRGTFLNHNYSFGLAPESPLRKEFNAALLKATAADSWTSLLATYLGKTD